MSAPSTAARPSAATSLTLQGHWQEDKSGSTSQFFPWEGTVLPNPNGSIPTNRFIGEPEYAVEDAKAWVESTQDPSALALASYGQQLQASGSPGGAADMYERYAQSRAADVREYVELPEREFEPPQTAAM